VPLSDVLESLRKDPELAGGFTAWRILPEAPACHAEFPAGIDPRLIDALRQRGIERLYSHQAEAAAEVLAGRNVVVVTPTASGKTLCYNLPVLQAILADSMSRALYLFPTKALAQDQMEELHGLIGGTGADIKTFTYDGDTPGEARRR
jgi:DEAD/DEAH box helicase domain-containing protein